MEERDEEQQHIISDFIDRNNKEKFERYSRIVSSTRIMMFLIAVIISAVKIIVYHTFDLNSPSVIVSAGCSVALIILGFISYAQPYISILIATFVYTGHAAFIMFYGRSSSPAEIFLRMVVLAYFIYGILTAHKLEKLNIRER